MFDTIVFALCAIFAITAAGITGQFKQNDQQKPAQTTQQSPSKNPHSNPTPPQNSQPSSNQPSRITYIPRCIICGKPLMVSTGYPLCPIHKRR